MCVKQTSVLGSVDENHNLISDLGYTIPSCYLLPVMGSSRGTGIRGLMRGMATLVKVTRSY